MELSKLKQRLEILWQEVEKLEQEGGGGGGPTDAYTKAQTDALLAEKADVTSVYSKANTYNKTETNAEIQGAIAALDVSSTSTSGHYIDYIAQEDGLIAPHSETAATSVISGSSKLITSGGVQETTGTLSNLQTSNKTNLVAAVNEVNSKAIRTIQMTQGSTGPYQSIDGNITSAIAENFEPGTSVSGWINQNQEGNPFYASEGCFCEITTYNLKTDGTRKLQVVQTHSYQYPTATKTSFVRLYNSSSTPQWGAWH